MPELDEVRKKKFRKRRKHEGEGFTTSQQGAYEKLEAAKRAGRVHCRECHKFIPWKELFCSIRRVKKNVIELSWACGRCGNAVLVKEYNVKRRKKVKS